MMCLEDRFLTALLNETHPVPLVVLSNSISITQNAATSIVHRITANFPHFILFQKEEGADQYLLVLNEASKNEVTQFLATGGYTAINEQEFLKYYKSELKKEKRKMLLKKLLSRDLWVRAAAGTGAIVLAGVAFVAAKSKNKSFSWNK